MHLASYRAVVRRPGVRQVLLLGFLVRLPMFATGLVLTLHVVTDLGRSYGEAGLVSAVFTVALALSAPWRGRLLDRRGLRRTLVPSLVVTSVVWTVLPFLPYAALLPASALAGAFAVPSFSILRQALIAAVPVDLRRTTLSLDSVLTELSFMIGPAAGVWAAATYDTRWVLVALAAASSLAALALYLANPPMRAPADRVDAVDHADQTASVGPTDQASAYPPARHPWVSLGVLATLAAASATTVVLGGTDVSIVAALRSTGDAGAIGWVLSVWAAGSLIGGLVYGAWHRSISVFWLLGTLAATTLPVALAPNLPVFVILLFLSGVACAPTITATIEQLARLVSEERRGEAMGWHGSAMTTGQAIGAPLAGFAIDHGGWGWGFASVSLLGVAVAVIGAAGVRSRSRQRVDQRTAV